MYNKIIQWLRTEKYYNKTMMKNLKNFEGWRFKELISDFDKFYINGLNIWDYKWIRLDEYVMVEDPLYGQKHNAEILCIEEDNIKIYFLAVVSAP